MPRKERNELKAGLFTLVGIALLLVIVVWIGASKLFSISKGQAYFFSPIEVGPLDLQPEYKVICGDVEVGKIAEVRQDFANKRTIYVVNFTADQFAVYRNAEARVSSGLLGGSALAITKLGDPKEGDIDAEHPVRIAGGLNEALANINDMSKTLKDELNDKDKKSLLSKIKDMVGQLENAATDIAKITKTLGPQLDPEQKDSIAANLATTMKNLATTSTTIDKYVQKDLGDLMVNIREIATAVLKTANNLDVSSDKIKQLLVANSGNINSMIDNMVAVSANLKAASTEIRRNPWRLLYQPDKKKMDSVNLYDAARAFNDGATELDMAVTKLKAVQALDPKDPDTSKEVERVRDHLKESFRKFKKVEDALWKEVSKDQ